jgi:hypothetical protein
MVKSPLSKPLTLSVLRPRHRGSPALFAASRIDARSADRVRRGTVEVREEDIIEIRLTPLTAGTHPLHPPAAHRLWDEG